MVAAVKNFVITKTMLLIYLAISILLIVVLTTRLHIHPFLTLFVVAISFGLVSGMPLATILQSVNEGFGGTLGKIGFIIVFGVLIGTFLENTGGAYKLAEKVLRLTGRKRVTPAMGIIGYIVSIPVFADSGFLLMSPLAKSLAKKAGMSLAGPAIALGLGLTASHVMVPPTPGPIAAAGILGADLGLVMMIGIPISLLTLIPAIMFASSYAGKTYIDPTPELSDEVLQNRAANAPGAAMSSIPIILPIVLIVAKSFVEQYTQHVPEVLYQIITFAGEPVIALFIGMVLALLLPKKLEKSMLSSEGWVGQALKDAAIIILITGAGGVFGKILQNSGITDLLSDTLVHYKLSVWLPFLLAAALKTAQGSSTVALITTASLLTPLMPSLGFDTDIEKALVVIAIGAGSAVVSHANDSFFWVVSQLTGLDLRNSYRLFTLGTFVLGTTAALLVYLTYIFVA